jgi:two-component system response regulator CpxR
MDLVAGNLRVNVASHVALLDGEALELTALEFAILVSLMKAKGRVKTREALIEEVSERRFDVFDRSIDVHISSLRKKLLDDPREPKFIRTVRGVGYTLGEPLTGDAR